MTKIRQFANAGDDPEPCQVMQQQFSSSKYTRPCGEIDRLTDRPRSELGLRLSFMCHGEWVVFTRLHLVPRRDPRICVVKIPYGHCTRPEHKQGIAAASVVAEGMCSCAVVGGLVSLGTAAGHICSWGP
jgi:hypothetical protein